MVNDGTDLPQWHITAGLSGIEPRPTLPEASLHLFGTVEFLICRMWCLLRQTDSRCSLCTFLGAMAR